MPTKQPGRTVLLLILFALAGGVLVLVLSKQGWGKLTGSILPWRLPPITPLTTPDGWCNPASLLPTARVIPDPDCTPEIVCPDHPDDDNACTETVLVTDPNPPHRPICVDMPIVCDDGDPCTRETCEAGLCVVTPIDCSDGDDCTIDTCAGTCQHVDRCLVSGYECLDDGIAGNGEVLADCF